jgi:hypothetical protein
MLVKVDRSAVISAHGIAELEPPAEAGVPDAEAAGIGELLEPVCEDPHAVTSATPPRLRTAAVQRRAVGLLRLDAVFITVSFPAAAG